MAKVRVVPRSLTQNYLSREADFSPNLVGLQFTDGASLFTLGNFQVTTNLESRVPKNFSLGGQWSEYYSLDNLQINETISQILETNQLNVKLNFNKKDIKRYVYFGSFTEFVRVTLEQIIQKWKGSLYVTPFKFGGYSRNTVLSFSYNTGNNTSEFTIPTTTIVNNFNLQIQQSETNSNELWDLNTNYDQYVLWFGGDKEYEVIEFTGSTVNDTNLRVKVKGNPFPGLSGYTFGAFTYHIKPNNTQVELFFKELTDFETLILDRLTTPIYTSTFNVPIKTESGSVYFIPKTQTWPISDGYNLDVTTEQYESYVQNILEMARDFDLTQTDLISRRFVSESIHEYDTNDGTNDEVYGMKITKLLKIYGREYDEVKKYIDGISFANVVTYDKLDNTSDNLIKIIAKNLGLDVLLTFTTDSFNLLEDSSTSSEVIFSGYSRTFSAKELDIELWRRIVLNAWWLFKSKGTRKVIEFFLNLFKIPECSVSLNEYVYLAENRLDIDKVYNDIIKIYQASSAPINTINFSAYPIDSLGFPKVLPETDSNFFQMKGFWYNGGNQSNDGNNPHSGTYDYGKQYIDNFRCFQNIKPFLTATTLVTDSKNYFNNYNKGTFVFDQNGLPIPFYGGAYANQLNNYTQNAIVNVAGLTIVGTNGSALEPAPSGDTYSMKVSFTTGSGNFCETCSTGLNYLTDPATNQGVVYTGTLLNPIPLDSIDCCTSYWLPNTGVLGTNNNYVCYWCPTPQVVCDSGTFLTLYTPTQQQNLATSLGWDSTSSLTPSQFITNIMNPFFLTYGCVLLDPNKAIISDESCCRLQGGNLIDINNKKYCVKNTINCNNGYTIGSNHVFVINT
jgi:hypothetical protein